MRSVFNHVTGPVQIIPGTAEPDADGNATGTLAFKSPHPGLRDFPLKLGLSWLNRSPLP